MAEVLRLGDCMEVMRQFVAEGLKFDLIYTDPPYDISATNGGGSMHKSGKLSSLKELAEANINKGYDLEEFGEIAIQLQNNINMYFWCNKIQIPRYLDFYVNKHKCKFDILFWAKTNPLPTYSNKYLSDVEYCLYFRKDGYCMPQSYDDARTFYQAPINAKDKKLYGHPTIKPLDAVMRHIRNSSKENDLVFDPFMGSGTTGVACRDLGRNFVGIEIDENYFNIAKGGIENELTEKV